MGDTLVWDGWDGPAEAWKNVSFEYTVHVDSCIKPQFLMCVIIIIIIQPPALFWYSHSATFSAHRAPGDEELRTQVGPSVFLESEVIGQTATFGSRESRDEPEDLRSFSPCHMVGSWSCRCLMIFAFLCCARKIPRAWLCLITSFEKDPLQGLQHVATWIARRHWCRRWQKN